MNGALSRREFVERGSTAAAIFSAASLGMLATACGRRADDRPQDTAVSAFQGPGDSTAWRGIVLQPAAGKLLISGGRWAPVRIKVESTNTGATTITWCAVYSPPGFEQLFKEVGVVPGNESGAPSFDRVREIASRYGMIFRS
jgi:hypothetical protein